MTRQPDESTMRLAIPKGRMYDGVARLLSEAGINLTQTVRSYRPHISLPGCEVKILKPQSIVEMLHAGSRDVGFAGADWVAELDGEAVDAARGEHHRAPELDQRSGEAQGAEEAAVADEAARGEEQPGQGRQHVGQEVPDQVARARARGDEARRGRPLGRRRCARIPVREQRVPAGPGQLHALPGPRAAELP